MRQQLVLHTRKMFKKLLCLLRPLICLQSPLSLYSIEQRGSNRALECWLFFHRLFKFRDQSSSWSQQTRLGNTDFKFIQSAQIKIKKELMYHYETSNQDLKKHKTNNAETEANENAA